jgi:mannose-6-phosphate isomerase-like protein (cupin superfamily)
MDLQLIKNNMDQENIKKDWDSRGYSFGIFKDPPGKIWADFVHKTDEIVVLAEGEIEIEIEGKSQQPQIGDEVFIPANVIHTVRNIGKTNNVWYYGYNV